VPLTGSDIDSLLVHLPRTKLVQVRLRVVDHLWFWYGLVSRDLFVCGQQWQRLFMWFVSVGGPWCQGGCAGTHHLTVPEKLDSELCRLAPGGGGGVPWNDALSPVFGRGLDGVEMHCVQSLAGAWCSRRMVLTGEPRHVVTLGIFLWALLF
jgi:hypothetical protein